MRRGEFRIWLTALMVGAVSIGLGAVHPIGAAVSPITQPASTTVGQQVGVAVTVEDDLGDPASQVTGQVTSGSATILSGVFQGLSGGQNCPGTVSNLSQTILFSASCVNGIDGNANSNNVTGGITVACNSAGQSTLAVTQGNGSPQSVTITCTSAGGGGTTSGNSSLVSVTAQPNVVPCGGGTSIITAYAVNGSGTPVPNLTFFNFGTDRGFLSQSPNSPFATLTLSAGQTSATVTATTVDSSGATKTGSVLVSQACNGFAAVVVTAQPNVIPCGGQSVITATARDVNGHAVNGVGFHLTVDSGGILAPPPNDATGEGNTALLTILPGQTSATVKVSVGTTVGDVAGQVTVQQFCSPETNAPGKVTLEPSATAVSCGNSLFIGATVKDSKGSIAADGTNVEFIASAGGFGPPQAPATTGSTTTPPSPDVTATTTNGALHVVYNAPAAFSGDVTITAGAGASFSPLTFHVSCGGIAGATSGRITAPNTGDVGVPRISPPNTGSGGLLRSE